MLTEQAKTLEGIQAAIQMEIDGKEYYLKIGPESGNELGKKLLLALAAEEDIHRQKFVEIYDAIRARQDWPIVVIPPDGGQRLLRDYYQYLKDPVGWFIQKEHHSLDGA